MAAPNHTNGGRAITVWVPISIHRPGGRKLVLAPDGAEVTAAPVTRHIGNAMVKASARAFPREARRYWRFHRAKTRRRMLVVEGVAEGE